MKPARFVAVVIAVGLFVSAFTVALPASNSASHKNMMTYNAALGLPSRSPLTLMAGTFALESLSSALTSEYSCSLVAQTPADWTQMGRRQYFDAKWTLKNTGTRTWGIHGPDVKFITYTGGAIMHTHGSLFNMPANTGPGQKVTIIVDMTAPKNLGYYTESWALVNGSTVFCRFWIGINVNHY